MDNLSDCFGQNFLFYRALMLPTPAIPFMRLHIDDLPVQERRQSPPNIHLNDVGDPLVQVAFWGPSNSALLHHNSDSNNADCPFVEESGSFWSLAACWTAPPPSSPQGLIPSFTHCEMRFANGYVCSIHEYILVPKPNYDFSSAERVERVPGYVHCRVRELDRKDYFFIEMPVAAEQHERMFRQACAYAARKTPFNAAGMYLNFVWPFRLWCPVERGGEAFFCSELVATLLRDAGVLVDVHPSTTSPNSLWQRLERMDASFVSYNRNSEAKHVLATLSIPPPRGGGKQLFTIPRVGK
jgi:hypothetical protein